MVDQNKSRIAELAASLKNTGVVDQYLQSHEIPSPSFDYEYNEPSHLPPEIVAAKTRVSEATEELNSLMLGPMGLLTKINTTKLPALHFLYRFKITSVIPLGEEMSFATIADRIGMGVADTERILRMAISQRLFRESRKGFVAHTAASKTLAANPLIDSWIGVFTEEIWPASSRVVDAVTRWPDSGEAAQTGYNLATGNENAYFDGLKNDPIRAKRFGEVMAFYQSVGIYGRAGLLDNYDWKPISEGLVVDLGGNQGRMIFDLARRYPKMKCISQDLPEVIATASVPSDLTGRVELAAHDFFAEQPVKGADAYLFQWIFHDWSDKYSIQILKNLIPALKVGARIIIGELCIPDPGSMSVLEDRRMRDADLVMKCCLNGKERNADEWAELFAKSDPRFKFQGASKLPNTRWAVMEAISIG